MASKAELHDEDYAVGIVRSVCILAGVPSYVDDLRAQLRHGGVLEAVRDRDTPRLFDWLMSILSFHGIADRVVEDFIDKNGNVTWSDIEQSLATWPTCAKLGGYWLFHGCRYHKLAGACAEPIHITACPLPLHPLRNGRLNQTAYSLFLFIRDVADSDVVGWLDQQLSESKSVAMAAARERLVGPLRHIYGVSDKVLAMALSALLMGTGRHGSRWFDVGASFVVIDTLVHNFLHRTGILWRLNADHPYGSGCYRPGGCADILEEVAAHIDASAFNPSFPKTFPRFVQSAVWRYCAEGGLDVCNGNRIRDEDRCQNVYCRLHASCDRIVLRPKRMVENAKNHVFSMV